MCDANLVCCYLCLSIEENRDQRIYLSHAQEKGARCDAHNRRKKKARVINRRENSPLFAAAMQEEIRLVGCLPSSGEEKKRRLNVEREISLIALPLLQ